MYLLLRTEVWQHCLSCSCLLIKPNALWLDTWVVAGIIDQVYDMVQSDASHMTSDAKHKMQISTLWNYDFWCRITRWGLTKLRILHLQCNSLFLSAHWTSGVRLREVKLSCKSLYLNPKWIPEDTFSITITLGPIVATDLEVNRTVELMKGWTGMKLEYIPVKKEGNSCQEVRASRKRRVWLTW